MRRQRLNCTIGAPNGKSWLNREFPLGFEMMTDALFEAILT
jgi:hypothetical protein